MTYLHTPTGRYPCSEAEIRRAHQDMSFPLPFVPPDGYEVVFQTPVPDHDRLTQCATETAPERTAKGVLEQRWAVAQLSQAQITDNYAALRRSKIAEATALRWAKETGGLTLPNGVKVATTTADQNRITAVIANAQLAGVSSVDFKAESGWATLTLADVQGIAAAIALHVQACFSAERAHHEAITALSAAELQEYDVTVGWPT